MNKEKVLKQLERIEASITAKGHPMQDSDTIKTALLDLLGIIRSMLKND